MRNRYTGGANKAAAVCYHLCGPVRFFAVGVMIVFEAARMKSDTFNGTNGMLSHLAEGVKFWMGAVGFSRPRHRDNVAAIGSL
jgi:hypothetical protein